MARIEIYTTPLCGFCHAAKRLLKSKDAVFAETDVSGKWRGAAGNDGSRQRTPYCPTDLYRQRPYRWF